jgi:hypothetical protein
MKPETAYRPTLQPMPPKFDPPLSGLGHSVVREDALIGAVEALCDAIELLVVDRRKALGGDAERALQSIDAVRSALREIRK